MPDRPAPDNLMITLPASTTAPLSVFKLANVYRRAVVGVYTDSTCLVAYVSGGVKGNVVFIKIGTDAGPLTPGRKVSIYDANDLTNTCDMEILNSFVSGSNTVLECQLLEADDNGTGTDLNNADYIHVTDFWLTGYLMAAWIYNSVAVDTVRLYARTEGMTAGEYSPDLLDGNGLEPDTAGVASDASPDKPKFCSGVQLYVAVATTTAGTILHLVFDPYCVQPTV